MTWNGRVTTLYLSGCDQTRPEKPEVRAADASPASGLQIIPLSTDSPRWGPRPWSAHLLFPDSPRAPGRVPRVALLHHVLFFFFDVGGALVARVTRNGLWASDLDL